MTHLNLDERLALIEAGGEREHPHLLLCARCRAEVDAARAVLADARAVTVPEPSPLFWDSLSRRISDRIFADGPDRVSVGWPFWRVLVPLTVTVCALLLAVGVDHQTRQRTLAPAEAGVSGEDAGDLADVTGTDDEWALLARLAGEFDFETLADSLGPSREGTAGSAVWELSEQERIELTALLRTPLQQ
jgi:hypothetical protein